MRHSRHRGHAFLGLLALVAVPLARTSQASPATSARSMVSVDVRGDTLGQMLPRLGRQAAEPLKCGPNAFDRRVFLFAESKPLGEVMAHLKRFVPEKPGTAVWITDGSGSLFDEDLASGAARLRALQRSRREEAKARTQRLQEMQRWYPETKGVSEQEIRARRSSGQMLSIFMALPAHRREEALEGRAVVVPFYQLSSYGKQLVRAKVEGHGSQTEDRPELTFVGHRDYPRTEVEIAPTGTRERPGLELLLRMRPSLDGVVNRDILNPPRFGPDGWEWGEIARRRSEQPRHPAGREQEPALQRTLSLQGGPQAYVESTLATLSEKAGLPLIGEYDPCYAAPHRRTKSHRFTLDSRAPLTNVPLWKALDRVCETFDLTWDYHAGWIYIRSPRTLRALAGEVDLSPPGEPRANNKQN